MNKRGLSGVIVIVLLILLAIVAAVILWGFVRSSIFTSSEDVEAGLLSSRVEIVSRSVKSSGSGLEFSVQRKPGDGNVIGVYYVIESSGGERITGEERKDLGELQATDLIDVDFTGYTDFEVSKIIAYPLVRNSKGQEKIGKISDEYEFESKPVITGTGGAGVGGSSCVDVDGDGYGEGGDASCPQVGIDCDDGNPSVNPGAEEICGNGIDDDCDGGDEPIGSCTGMVCLDRIVTIGLVPNGDVGPNEWDLFACSGDHFSCVDDHEDTSDFNPSGDLLESSVNNLREVFDFEPLVDSDSLEIVEVSDVKVWVAARNFECYNYGVDVYFESEWKGQNNMGTVCGGIAEWRDYILSGGPWSAEDLEDIRVEVDSFSSDSNYHTYLEGLFVEVTYERTGHNVCEA